MINLNRPPLRDPINGNNGMSHSWLKFFSQLGDSLFGKWGNEERNITRTNVVAPTVQQISYTGFEVSFLFIWDQGVTFSTSILELEKNDYSVFPSALYVIDGNRLLNDVAIVDGKTITLPDLTSTNRVIVQGTALVEN